MNARVIKTKAALRQALFTMLETTPIEKISVAALCRQANITRKTFYTHYDHVADVFEDYQEDMALQVQTSLADGTMDATRLLKVFDRILMANFAFFRYLCRQMPQADLITALKTMLEETFAAQLIPGEATGRQRLLLHLVASGAVDSYVYWFQHPDLVDYDTVIATNTKLLSAIANEL